MKVSILCNTFLAGFLSCQKLNVFTTVETIQVISTQGQTEPLTTRTVSSSVITSQVFLSSSVEPIYSRFPGRFSNSWTQYLPLPTKASATSISSARSTSTSKSSTSTKASSSSSWSSSSSTASSSVSSSSSATPPSATGLPLPDLPAAVDYVSTGLYYHNIHRLNHTAPLIVWNPAQAIIAAEIASSCVFAHNMTVGGGGYGQNLAAYGATGNVAGLSPSSMLAKSITNQWYYGEVNSFLPSYYGQLTPDMSNFEAWGHFTQVVWKGSLTVGCASQLCPAGTIFSAPYESWFTVCNYVAPGNYIGQFGLNVSPAIGLPSIGPV